MFREAIPGGEKQGFKPQPKIQSLETVAQSIVDRVSDFFAVAFIFLSISISISVVPN